MIYSCFNKVMLISLLFVAGICFSKDIDKRELKVKLLNQWQEASLSKFKIITDILEERYQVIETKSDDYDLVIDGVFGEEKIKNKNAFKIFFTGEAIPAKIDTSYKREKCITNHENFACFLVSNGRDKSYYDGVDARDHLFFKLSLYKPVLSGGNHLNNIGKIVPVKETNDWLSKCKFTIAYENKTYPGYITEKLFQAHFAGSIPIYYSDVEAQKDININAIISAQKFSTEEELIDYIISVDKDDQKYCQIWNEKLIIDSDKNYKNIQNKIREKLSLISF